MFTSFLLLVVVVLSQLKGELFHRGNFLFPLNIASLLRMSVPILMISSVFTLIFITGNIDLSVGSTLSLTTVTHALLVINGVPFLWSLILVITLGVVLGSINAVLVTKLRITPVIATLITLNAYQGIARYLVPPGISAITDTDVAKMPAWMGDFSKTPVFLGISWAFIVAIVPVDRSGDPGRKRPCLAGTWSRSAATRRRRSFRASTWPEQ